MEALNILESDEMVMKKPAETSNYLPDQSICSQYYPQMMSPKSQLLQNNFNCTQKQPYSTLSNSDFLSKCDEFIIEHTNPKSKQTKRKPVNFSTSKNHISPIKQCQKCKIYYERQLEWLKQKLNLQRVVEQLEEKLCQINNMNTVYQQKQFINVGIQAVLKSNDQRKLSRLEIMNEVFTINIMQQFQSYLSKSRTFSQQTMSTIQSSQISPSQFFTDREVFLQSLKSYNEKLESTQSQNKYLKIQNYTLMKTKAETKTQMQTIKREMQKTKSQRDMFKKKLIAINDKQHSSNTRENNEHVRLKQRRNQSKNNEQLFQLSLTDSQIIKQENNNNSKLKKIQRPQFITQKQQK